LTFSEEDRKTNVERIGYVASEIARHGGIAICAAIAPHQVSRETNRKKIGQVGTYVEVFVATSLEECTKRDTKGLYAKALKGEIKNFTGVSDVYEKPQNAEVVVDTEHESPDESVGVVLSYLQSNSFL